MNLYSQQGGLCIHAPRRGTGARSDLPLHIGQWRRAVVHGQGEQLRRERRGCGRVVVAAVDAVRRELAWLRHQQRVGGGHRARHGVPRRKRWAAHRLVSSSRLF